MRVFDYITHHFGQIVKNAIRFSLFNLLLFAIILFAISRLMHIIPTGLIPKEDKGVVFCCHHHASWLNTESHA